MAPVQRDPHSALKTEVVARANITAAEVVLARLQWSKSEVGYSLHVNPTQFSMSGLQRNDFLKYLGFTRSDQCSFTGFRRCYHRWVEEDFDISKFVTAFELGYAKLLKAEEELAACGFALPRPEGFGFFNGGPSRQANNPLRARLSGDGHTGLSVNSMKQTEDQTFLFQFTFLETASEKGFVTHYRPKHPPLSDEMKGIFKYLGFSAFEECPQFDFEQCYYHTLRFEQRGDGPFDSNTEFAHRSFDAHATRFSPGIQNLWPPMQRWKK